MRKALVSLLLLATLQAQASPIVLCAVGDSITEAFSPATWGWSAHLVQLHAGENFSAKNAAQSGDKVAAGALVFDREIAGLDLRGCTAVALLIGTNNLPDGTSAATIYSTLNSVCNAVEAAGKPCLLMGLLPRGTGASITANLEQRRIALNALMAARSGSTYVDSDTPLREAQGAFTGATPTAWVSTTAYVVGNTVSNNGYRYMCLTSGTSAGSGGPTTTGTDITDGTAHWTYIPAISTAAGGATDGLHPNNTGQLIIAKKVDCVAAAAGLWVASPESGCP
jgi:lysophospholipase L1-like esterase